MKSTLILILFIFSFTAVFSQTYPVSQNLGSPQTLIISKGGFKADSALILPYYPDTTTANSSPYIKYYAGNMIRVGNIVYVRNSTATGWVTIASGSGGGTAISGLNAFGNFYDTTLQEIGDTDTSYIIKIGKKDTAKGITLYNNKIIVDSPGCYNIQWTAQLENTSYAYQDIYAYIWIAKNGTIVPQSTRISSALSRHSSIDDDPGINISSSNYIINLKSKDTIQFFWVATDPTVRLNSFKNLIYPNRPIAPSFSVNISPVISGGSSGGGGTVTKAVDTIYRTVKKDSIQFTINGKYYAIKDSVGGGSSNSIDSIRRKIASDSVFGYIQGLPIFQFRDSVGSGGATADTSNAFVNNIVKVNDSTLRFYKGSNNTNLVLSNGRFKNNIIIKSTSSTRLGKYVGKATPSNPFDSTIIPVAGLDLDNAFKLMVQDTINPSYTNPSATSLSVNSGLAFGSYEIGTLIGGVTMNSTYSNNDAGGLTKTDYDYSTNGGTTWQTFSTTIPTISNTPKRSDTFKIVGDSLKSLYYFRARQYYDTGVLKYNNFGQPYYTGRVVKGSVVSSYNSYYYNPVPKLYYGYTTTGSSIPTDAQIIAALGGGTTSTGARQGTYTINCGTTPRNVFFAYPKSYNTITSLIYNALNVLPAFSNPITTRIFKNAQGYAQEYYIYFNPNDQYISNVTFTIN